MPHDKETYTANQLAEERTLLAFIRTAAIFCGLYILLKKNSSFVCPHYIPIFIAALLVYRLIYIDHAAHKMYIRMLGGLLLVCITSLVFYS